MHGDQQEASEKNKAQIYIKVAQSKVAHILSKTQSSRKFIEYFYNILRYLGSSFKDRSKVRPDTIKKSIMEEDI